MRTRRGVVVAAAVLCSVALGASAAQAQIPTQDSVRVTGNAVGAGGSFYNLDFAVQSDPTGGNVSGHGSFNLGLPTGQLVEGPATCLEVEGNIAYVAINDATFRSVVAKLVDGGPAGSGLDRLDAFLSNGTSTNCGFSPFRENPVTGGDVVVVDAPPLPTSKEQCKHGGWRTFGDTFTNQGQCVAFVQRGPKP